MSIDFEQGVERERLRNGYDDPEEQLRPPTRMRGPIMPGRTEKWLTLPAPYGDTDPPMKIKAWINFPNKYSDDLTSGDEDLIYEAWSKIIVEHNDWCDEDGQALPKLIPGDADRLRRFWGLISNECAQVISTLIFESAGKAAASLQNRAARRRGR